MHIYLKQNEELKKIQGPHATAQPFNTLFGLQIKESGFEKYIEVPNDTTAFPEELKEIFLRASVITSPNFPVHRTYGEYRLGGAVAKVIPYNAVDSGHKITIETSTFEGLGDMHLLFEELWLGTIVPIKSYENEQRKIHLLDVLRQLLSTRKLNWVQRFFLSMRMLAR